MSPGGAFAWSTTLKADLSPEVVGIFHWPINIVLGSAQPLAEMSSKNTSCGVKVDET